MKQLSLIVAKDENGLIGKDNGMPWDLPNDLRNFRNITTPHTVVMGRKTFESLGKPLRNRENVVLTTDLHYQADGCIVLHSVDEVLSYLREKDKAFIIGGNQIYRLFFPYVNEVYLTEVHGVFEGDTTLSISINEEHWTLLSEERHDVDERHAVPYTFKVYHRKD